MGLQRRLLLAVAIELLYCISTRAWLPRWLDDGIPLELAVTAARLVSAYAYWCLFRALISSRRPAAKAFAGPLLPVGLAVLMLAPVLAGDWGLDGAATRWVFAATSLAVALREELLYRGVLQNLLERRLGWVGAVLASNVVFVIYHYGAWPFSAQYVLEFFLVGCLVGLVYRASGSLTAAVVLHAVYDAVWCFTPYLPQPLGWGWGTALQGGALLLVAAWAWRRLGGRQAFPVARER